jgi:putative DNA primase/helicase
MKIRDHAKGKWPKIIAALLGDEFVNTRKHRACPGTGEGTDRFRFSDRNGCGNFFCGCSDGEKDGFELLMCAKGWSFSEAARAVEGVIGKCEPEHDQPKRNGKTINDRITAEAKQVSRSRYLENRGLEMAPALRFVDRLDYFEDGKIVNGFPAMVAPIRRGADFLSYHVTYLENGKKAPVDPCRKVMPGAPLAGGSVPLYPPAKGMGVAEGIETAIAATMLYHIPVWAALNTSLMKTWQPPPVAEEIVIFADADQHFAGHAAAYALAHRLVKRGLKVQIEFPTHGKDFNDMLLQLRRAA